MSEIRTKLLIVDNSLIVRRLIERSLKIEDYEILTAPNGLEAMRIFETFSLRKS